MRRLTSRSVLIPVLAAVSGLLYLGYSLHFGFVGFPLDDAWIHQTYARNLGLHHQLAYNLGEPSVGSTSPLWTLLLVPAHALRFDPALWTSLLGALFLALTGWAVARLADHLVPHVPWAALFIAAFCLLEWHLAWAAFSGMETILFVFLSLLALERHLADERPFFVGLINGMLTLARPEGVIMPLLLLLDTVWRHVRERRTLCWRRLGMSIGALLLGLLLPILPYMVTNLSISGNLFPNTFYAKQAEYQELVASLPTWRRWAQVALAAMVGAQVLLVPGFIHAAYRGVTQRSRAVVLPVAWWLVLITLYAVRLPVTYQHGRYVIPTIPVFVLLGVWGTWNLPRLHRVLRQVLALSIPILLVVFWLRGAQQYATDVRIIDSELKTAGVWIRDNTPSDAIVGAHDIGAVGYFSERFLVDTAGLITPEVVPFIRDEDRILSFLEEKEVDNVVIFPSWYPQIASSAKLRSVYRSTYPWVVQAGGDNVVVYETTWGSTE